MPDWGKALSTAFKKSLANSGNRGNRGNQIQDANNINELDGGPAVTTGQNALVTVVTGEGGITTVTTRRSAAVTDANAQKGLSNKGSFRPVTTVTTVTTEIDDALNFEERAALIEDGTHAPRAWCEGFAKLNVMKRPTDFSAARWEAVVNDGGVFMDSWAHQAALLGWTALDVFGAHPRAPHARLEAAGLVLLIGGGQVTAITQQTATIRAPNGSELRYWRKPSPGAVPLWELIGGAQ